MRIEHNKLLRLIAVFLMSLTALITANQPTLSALAKYSPDSSPESHAWLRFARASDKYWTVGVI